MTVLQGALFLLLIDMISRVATTVEIPLSILTGLIGAPLFVLDEPTSHLDYGNQIKVLKTIRAMADDGYGIVMTTHNPDHVLLLNDRIGVLNRQGRMTFGSCGEIMREDFLKELYGTDLRLLPVAELGRTVCAVPKLKVSQGGYNAN